MHQYKGKIILHTGSMFSGKTSSLLSDLKRFQIAQYKVGIFKSSVDCRFSEQEIVSHDSHRMRAVPVLDVDDLANKIAESDIEVVGIDEVQFIAGQTTTFLQLLDRLTEDNKTIILAGLDMDYLSQPFELIKELMPRVDYLYKHHAVCSDCGIDAWVSHRITSDDSRIKLGATDVYQPLCRACWKRAINSTKTGVKECKKES